MNFYQVFEETTHRPRPGEEIPRQEVILPDFQASIYLILYNQDVNTLSEGKSYIVKNMSPKTVYVNTTTECNFEYEKTYQLKDTPFKTQMLLLKSL